MTAATAQTIATAPVKVLMSAFACEPGWGSEPEAGWRLATEAARFHDVWVITHASHRAAIEAEMHARPVTDLHFAYVDSRVWLHAGGLLGLVLRLQYVLWQFKALRVARRLYRHERFDLGHHVTYASMRYPTFLAFMGIPFIWGPVGGGEGAPAAFSAVYGRAGRLFERLRSASTTLVRFDPMVRIAASRAAVVLALTDETARALPGPARRKASVMPTIAIDPHAEEPAPPRAADGTTRLLYLGRLEYLKGVQLAVPALARAVDAGADVTLTFVGDGPMRPDLEQLASSLGVSARTEFRQRVPRDQVPAVLADHDVLIFPSFRDSGGYVALEAMAAARPVICLALGGPAVTVDDASGIRVPAIDPEQAIAGLAEAITRLASDPALRSRLGEGARARAVQVYGWDKIGLRLRDLYAEVLSARP